MINIAFYKVTREIARRCDLLTERYVTKDGDYILDNRDLARIELTTQEFEDNVELLSKEQALQLIEENHHTFGSDDTEIEQQEENNEQQE